MAGCCWPTEELSSHIDDHSNWMSELPESLHSVPVNLLAIPGSHDSSSYYLDKNGELAPDNPKEVEALTKIFGKFAKDIIYNWSKCQDLSYTQQFNAGIRYFDMRVSTKQGTEDLYFVHGLYAPKVEPCFKEIRTFLDEHPKEIVFLDINHLLCMTEIEHRHFLSNIIDIFGDKMCPYLDTESTTLEMLWENNLQVFVFYHNEIIQEFLQFWPGNSIPAPWPRKNDVDSLIKQLEDNYKQGHPDDIFYVTQGVLTPDVCFILAHLGGTLKNDLAKKVAEAFTKWLQKKHAGKGGINICIMDCVEMCQYASSVIALNKHVIQ